MPGRAGYSMKKYLLIIAAALFCLASCVKERVEDVPVELPVSFTNTSGDWELSEWKGQPVEQGSVYIRLKNKEFVLWQKVGSMYPVKYTGSYNLLEEDGVGTIIRGIYDYTYDYWGNQYIISKLYSNKMVWVSADDPDDTYIYIRTESFPAE